MDTDVGVVEPDFMYTAVERFDRTGRANRSEMLIHELFEEQVRKTPELVALEWGDRSLSYADLNARADRLASKLQRHGLQPDDIVGICANRTGQMIVAIVAILKAGGAYMPLDPNYPAERLRVMLEDASLRIILAHEEFRPLLTGGRAEFLTLDDTAFDENEPATHRSARELGQTSDNLLYVIYTSGSTGRPKGTAMSHGAMANLIEWHSTELPLTAGQRVLQFAAMSFDVAFQETFSTLCAGGTLVLPDEWIRRDPRSLARFMNERRIQRLFVPPLMLRGLAECFRASRVVPTHVRDVITAGEQLRIGPEIRDFFSALPGCRLHNHYGPTETHVVTALTLSGASQAWPNLPTIGRPIANVRIHIVDEQLTVVSDVGEIYIGGDGLARGYLHRPDLTAQRFTADPFSADPRARLYRTGDLGRWNRDGTIEYLGRNDHQVKVHGYRIELGEIETQIAEQTGVADVAVAPVEDPPGTTRLAAYITERPGARVDIEALRESLRRTLPDHMVPGAIVTLHRMPLSPNGKLDRAALPIPDFSKCDVQEYEVPEGELEEQVACFWRDVLGVRRVGRNDNFFDLGGNSVAAMQVVARLQSALMVEVTVRSLFEHPRLSVFSSLIGEARSSAMDQLVETLQAMPEGEAKALLQQLGTEAML